MDQHAPRQPEPEHTEIREGERQEQDPDTTQLLSLQQIANWQLPQVVLPRVGAVAGLPALQRGAVWKPHQVECLWDSLVRGFPIGAFLLAPFERERGQQPFKNDESIASRCRDFHLLDGQQRANAIALGFLNPWARDQVHEALWVDLAPPPEASDARFLFRVLTNSHPWGYRRGNAASRISNNDMHKAMVAFCRVSPAELQGKRPAQIPLRCAWPYEADAPIPMALLLEAVQDRKNDPIVSLRGRLEQVPIWNAALREGLDWARNVGAALAGTDPRLTKHLNDLCCGLSKCLDESIPAIVLRAADRREQTSSAAVDAWETLFIRVNTKGTPLGGEELIYSLLKSAWPPAQPCVEYLQFRMIPAPRLVLLATRLVLASSLDHKKTPPPAPNVAAFRKLLQRDEFSDSMKHFMGSPDRGRLIFQKAKSLLEDGEYGLLPVLSCGIARSKPDILLLLLRWVGRMLAAGKDPCALDAGDVVRRRIVGTITALAWFAPDPGQCVSLLWERLESCCKEELSSFFSRSTFRETLRLGAGDSVRMLPLVPPKVLADFIDVKVTGSKDFLDPKGACWTAWNWGERMQPGSLPDNVVAWYRSSCAGLWDRLRGDDGNEFNLPSTSSRLWGALVGRLGDWRRRYDLLLYAQRGWIRACFPGYDPSLPDQMEDINCPWDYDHVHAHNYVAGRWYIPQIIKDWHGTMGNFRAWPFDINRSDGDDSPRKKFENVSPLEVERYSQYGLSIAAEKRRLSFIAEDAEWPCWRESTPTDQFEAGYLGNNNNSDCRQALVRAVTSRFVRIYRDWYESLCIADLMDN